MTVDVVFFHGDAEHLGRAGAVDILALVEYVLLPLLAGKPCDHSGFNGGKVSNDKFAVALWNECRADQLGKGVRHIFVEHFHGVKVYCTDKPSGFGQIA